MLTVTVDSITLTKEERDRCKKDQAEKLQELKEQLKQTWLHGKAHRLETGRLLILLRQQVEHGQWGPTLKELGIPPQTARDYMEEVATADEIHGFRANEPDAETVAMEEAVADAKAEVNGDKPAPQPKPQLAERNSIKGPVLYVSATQKEAFQAAKKADSSRVYKIFYAALLEVIGEEEVADEAIAA